MWQRRTRTRSRDLFAEASSTFELVERIPHTPQRRSVSRLSWLSLPLPRQITWYSGRHRWQAKVRKTNQKQVMKRHVFTITRKKLSMRLISNIYILLRLLCLHTRGLDTRTSGHTHKSVRERDCVCLPVQYRYCTGTYLDSTGCTVQVCAGPALVDGALGLTRF